MSDSKPGIKKRRPCENEVMGCEAVSINRDTIDLRYVEQLTDSEQLTTLGYCIRYAQKQIIDGKKTLQEIVGELEKTLDKGGLEALSGSGSSVPCMAMPRRQEISPALTGTEG